MNLTRIHPPRRIVVGEPPVRMARPMTRLERITHRAHTFKPNADMPTTNLICECGRKVTHPLHREGVR